MSTTKKTSNHPSQSATNGFSVAKQHRESPTFNLKAVVTETGLKPDTLRAWERRYGLPDPDRTSGGHRLYSRRDIEMLNWLIARQDEGLSISRAIKLWRRIEAGGQDPLTDERYVSTPQPVESPTAVSRSISAGNNVGEFREAWVQACMDFDERQAESVLSQAFAILPIETVCHESLQKGLQEVGQGWYEGEITV
ncbi:MAG: MerR family transcriptional regulator, partial [Anaerolineales bacterium]|nr:MerR family transcriptional regulator [Anaerolineales bacterium]